MTDAGLRWLTPDWPAPAHVRALTTLRSGGCSREPWHSLNLGDHVGDDPAAVAANRLLLQQECQLPAAPLWLQQVHGCDTVELPVTPAAISSCVADAAFTAAINQPCAVLTADCLPLLITDKAGREVAAVHAGWRGLHGGVIESALARFDAATADLLVWLGPAISQQAFEVGAEVRTAFVSAHAAAAKAFLPNAAGRWQADLYLLARQALQRAGVHHIYGGEHCTFGETADFFSYRRDGVTGRMASLIWLASS
jgi:YfiH family protein